jgi:hypothetical protein
VGADNPCINHTCTTTTISSTLDCLIQKTKMHIYFTVPTNLYNNTVSISVLRC